MIRKAAQASKLETQLSAHLDGEMTDDERQEIEALLVNDPQARVLHDSLKRGADFGRRVCDDLLKEPVPLDLVRAIKNAPLPRRAVRLPQAGSPSLHFRPTARQSLIACLVFLMIGGGLGYVAGTRPGMTDLAEQTGVGIDPRDWLDDVVSYYRLYTHQPNRLTEIAADRPAEILEWLTTETGVGFRIPDLKQSGLKFAGARLFTAAGQPFALLLYRRSDDGEVIAIAFSRNRPETAKPVEDIRSDTGIVTWSTPLATYAIIGPSSAADLDDIAAKAAGLI
jgi:anti-sigma factor RsiW